MARLIDADVLIDSINDRHYYDFIGTALRAIVVSQPTAPYRTAELRQYESEFGFQYYRCMGCGVEHSSFRCEELPYKYCPHCGAKFKEATHANAD